MSDLVFPTLPGMGLMTRRIMHRNIVQTASSGREVRIVLWKYPRYEWDITFNFLDMDGVKAFQTIADMFNLQHGGFGTMLFVDPTDYKVTDQTIGTGNGSTTKWQLQRSFGGFNEPVYAIKTDVVAPVIKLNGSVTSAYTINNDTGEITFSSAPGGGVTITGTYEYYYRVRFKDDQTEYQEILTKMWESKKITLITANQV